MDVKVTVNGVEATITVSGPAEAAALLSSISGMGQQSPSKNNSTHLQSVESNGHEAPVTSSNVVESLVDEEGLRAALGHTRGTPASLMLKTLANSTRGMSDAKLRIACELDEGQHFGPMLSLISKACKRRGLTIDSVVTKQTQRGQKGKMHYFFKLTDQAAKIIRETPNFEAQPDFPLFEDEDE